MLLGLWPLGCGAQHADHKEYIDNPVGPLSALAIANQIAIDQYASSAPSLVAEPHATLYVTLVAAFSSA